MPTRKQLLAKIKNARTGKKLSIAVILIGILSFLFFDKQEEVAIDALMRLDQGKLNQVRLK